MAGTSENKASRVWEAYFVPPCAPGVVYRLLERRARQGDHSPFALLLSDEVFPRAVRALFAPDAASCPFLRDNAPLLSQALSGPVTLLYRNDSHYGWQVWEKGKETGQFAGDMPLSGRRLWRLLIPEPAPPPVLWARRRGLPFQRVPGLEKWGPRHTPKNLPVIDYESVALLDQKNLLVEDTPRLYCFHFQSD